MTTPTLNHSDRGAPTPITSSDSDYSDSGSCSLSLSSHSSHTYATMRRPIPPAKPPRGPKKQEGAPIVVEWEVPTQDTGVGTDPPPPEPIATNTEPMPVSASTSTETGPGQFDACNQVGGLEDDYDPAKLLNEFKEWISLRLVGIERHGSALKMLPQWTKQFCQVHEIKPNTTQLQALYTVATKAFANVDAEMQLARVLQDPETRFNIDCANAALNGTVKYADTKIMKSHIKHHVSSKWWRGPVDFLSFGAYSRVLKTKYLAGKPVFDSKHVSFKEPLLLNQGNGRSPLARV